MAGKLDYVADARYGWAARCLEQFGSVPRQILDEWNTVAHVTEFEGQPHRRPLTYDEVQALFDAADGRVEEIRSRGRKGALAAQRDAALLKMVYAFGLRRREAWGLDLPDLRRNPQVPQFAGYGAVFVRWGKSSNGSPPKRRTVLTVPEMDWAVPGLQQWVEEVRPLFTPGNIPALWVTERCGRLSPRAINEAFEEARGAAPACAECGKITIDLRRKTASGRVCGTCAARGSTGTCARCGRVRRISARRPEGGICSACYDKDEQVVTECSGCGRRRRPVARIPDGTTRCQFCATRPARTCSACGQQRTVAGTAEAGPVCASCYQAPQRPCGRCGRTRKIARRATASAPDLCYGCYQGALAVCSVCGQTRPCQRISAGSPICRSCRARPPRPCSRCGRDRPVQAEWPAGPVCVGCYEHVRRHPAECAGCGVVRPLIGGDEQGRPVCGPCAGVPGMDYTCRECGRGGEIHSGRHCFSCVLAERARILLTGPGGEVPAQLHPLLEALTTVTNPATVVKWLGTSRSARLLGRLARTGDPITHDLLDDLPQTQALHYVREVLVSSGVLPARNEHLERLAPWLEHLLQGKPTRHARLIRPFMHWFVLRRARRAAARRTFTRGSASPAPASWPPWTCCPGWTTAVRPWMTSPRRTWTSGWLTAPPTRRAVRYFLQWAHGRGLAGDLAVPFPPRPEPARLLAEDDHIRQLDRCLTDEAMPLDLRVGGALVLLFGMLVSRITQLTRDDVIEDGQATCLSVDGHRLMLPPRLAHLVRQLRDQGEPRWTLARLGTPAPWLFPGQSPARPAVDILFGVRLHRYGIDAHAGRNTGPLALVAELPASVLADLTGISISTAERRSQWAKRDWAAYVGQRAADDAGGIDSGNLLNEPAKHGKRH